ncbi:thermonuclease family protein, partial [Dickeya oryzae]|uniref:thermonuclease family protein n=1 Tax=Dickeya oryzae TaxID=1240404 RepID=UPI001AED04F3
DQLKKLIAGQSVTVSYTEHDRYGRIIGRVSLQGTDASTYMVSAGAAWVYDRYNTDDHLPDIQRQAQAAQRGLWTESDPVPPWVWRRQNH